MRSTGTEETAPRGQMASWGGEGRGGTAANMEYLTLGDPTAPFTEPQVTTTPCSRPVSPSTSSHGKRCLLLDDTANLITEILYGYRERKKHSNRGQFTLPLPYGKQQ